MGYNPTQPINSTGASELKLLKFDGISGLMVRWHIFAISVQKEGWMAYGFGKALMRQTVRIINQQAFARLLALCLFRQLILRFLPERRTCNHRE